MTSKTFWFVGIIALVAPVSVRAISLAPTTRMIVAPAVTSSAVISTTSVVTPNSLIKGSAEVVTSDHSVGPATDRMINPQPEPSVVRGNLVVNPGEQIGINLQPEPPVGAGVSANPNVTVSNKLNPQPEPPMPTNAVERIPEQAKRVVTPMERQGLNPQPEPPAIPVDVLNEIKIEDGQPKLIEGEKKFLLRSTPENFVMDLNRALTKQGFATSSVGQVRLQVVENKAIYMIKVKEKAKLFGIIPMSINSDITLSAEDNAITKIKRPWYAKLATMVNNAANVKLVPDFALTNLELVPNAYKAGDSATARVTLSNIGTTGTQTEFSIFGSGTKWVVKNGEWQVAMFLTGPLYMAPGDSYTFDLGFKSYDCSPVKVEFDPGNFLKEEDISNNTITVSGNCTQ